MLVCAGLAPCIQSKECDIYILVLKIAKCDLNMLTAQEVFSSTLICDGASVVPQLFSGI